MKDALRPDRSEPLQACRVLHSTISTPRQKATYPLILRAAGLGRDSTRRRPVNPALDHQIHVASLPLPGQVEVVVLERKILALDAGLGKVKRFPQPFSVVSLSAMTLRSRSLAPSLLPFNSSTCPRFAWQPAWPRRPTSAPIWSRCGRSSGLILGCRDGPWPP